MSGTELLFYADARLRSCEARVVEVGEGGILLDRTVFYPLGGGQPGDTGVLTSADGREITIADTRKGEVPGTVLHLPVAGATELKPGDRVVATIDWARRHRLMRMQPACIYYRRWCLPALPAVRCGSIPAGWISICRSGRWIAPTSTPG